MTPDENARTWTAAVIPGMHPVVRVTGTPTREEVIQAIGWPWTITPESWAAGRIEGGFTIYSVMRFLHCASCTCTQQEPAARQHYFARELCRAVLPDIESPCEHHEEHTVSIDVTMGAHRYTVKVSR